MGISTAIEDCMESKKNRAIVLGSTGNLAFAVGCLVMNLKRCMKYDYDNIIIYYDGYEKKDLEIIKKIEDRCIFIQYTQEDFFNKLNVKNIEKTKQFLHWTHISFSIYEIFDLLDKYHEILWLDCDIIIKKNFSELFTLGNVLMRPGYTSLNYALGGGEEDLNNIKCFNSGVVLCKDIIQYKDLTNQCYIETKKRFLNLKLPDQAIISYVLLKNNIDITIMDKRYNNFYPFTDIEDAKIIHTTACKHKPWSSSLLSIYFVEFTKEYRQWVLLGGSRYINDNKKNYSYIGNSLGELIKYLDNIQLFINEQNKIIKNLKKNFYIKTNIQAFVIKIFNKKIKDNYFYKIQFDFDKKNVRISLCTNKKNNIFISLIDSININILSKKKYIKENIAYAIWDINIDEYQNYLSYLIDISIKDVKSISDIYNN